MGAVGLVLVAVGVYKKSKSYWILGLAFAAVSGPLLLWDMAYLYTAAYETTLGWIDGDTDDEYNTEPHVEAVPVKKTPEEPLEPQPWHGDTVKAMTPDIWADQIDPEFYRDFGAFDWYRFPLVYPYTINCIDIADQGHLSSENGDLTPDSDYLGMITHLTFDNKYLLVRTDADLDYGSDATPAVVYKCYDWVEGEIRAFESEAELFKYATARNFTGEVQFMAVREYWDRF
jgi:hypothetical protein